MGRRSGSFVPNPGFAWPRVAPATPAPDHVHLTPTEICCQIGQYYNTGKMPAALDEALKCQVCGPIIRHKLQPDHQ